MCMWIHRLLIGKFTWYTHPMYPSTCLGSVEVWFRGLSTFSDCGSRATYRFHGDGWKPRYIIYFGGYRVHQDTRGKPGNICKGHDYRYGPRYMVSPPQKDISWLSPTKIVIIIYQLLFFGGYYMLICVCRWQNPTDKQVISFWDSIQHYFLSYFFNMSLHQMLSLVQLPKNGWVSQAVPAALRGVALKTKSSKWIWRECWQSIWNRPMGPQPSSSKPSQRW